LARPLDRPASPNPVPQNFLHGRLAQPCRTDVPVSGDRCGDAVGFSLSTRRRCNGGRQAERAGVTPRTARPILKSADDDPACPRRLDGMDTDSMLAAPLDTSIRGMMRFL